MRKIQANSPTGIPSLRYAAVIAALLAAIAIYTGFEKQAQTADTPTPTPTPLEDRNFGDTPIVVSGGSVHLDFNNGTFKPCIGAPIPCPAPSTTGNKMYWATGKIGSGYYYNDNDGSADVAYPLTITAQAVTITLKCSGGGNSGDIIVKNDDPAKNRVLVEFDETTKFKPRRANSTRRTNKKFKLDKLLVKDGGSPEKDHSTDATWPRNNKVTIELFGAP